MIRLRVDYGSPEEKDKLLEAIRKSFKVGKVVKDPKKEKDIIRRLFIDMEVFNEQ